MKVLCLGTGAADWRLDKRPADAAEWRRYTSSLVDRKLLIDPGPHIFDYLDKCGDPTLFDGIENILVTHSHGDHFCNETVKRLCVERGIPLWGSFVCLKRFAAAVGEDVAAKIDFHEIREYEEVKIGDYTVLPMRSNHRTEFEEEVTFHYIVDDGARRLFYALDGAWMLRRPFHILRQAPVDTVIIDATCGNVTEDVRMFEHNTVPMVTAIIGAYRMYKCLRYGTGKAYANHLAKDLTYDQKTMEALYAPHRISVCYDGLEIDV